MSRHDYGAIASRIMRQRCTAGDPASTHVSEHLDGLVEDLIAYFQESNPRFDADRFRKATGMVTK